MAQFPRFFIIAVFIFFSVPIYFSLFGLCLGFALGLWRREVMMIALCFMLLSFFEDEVIAQEETDSDCHEQQSSNDKTQIAIKKGTGDQCRNKHKT